MIGDNEQIIAAKRPDTAFLFFTDGETWGRRQSDLRKIMDHQNNGGITRIYTHAMAERFDQDLRRLKTEFGLLRLCHLVEIDEPNLRIGRLVSISWLCFCGAHGCLDERRQDVRSIVGGAQGRRWSVRWSDVFRPLVGEFKVGSATGLTYRPR